MSDHNRYELPEEETSKRAKKLGKFLLALVVNWRTTLLLVALIWVAWRERFWNHPVMWVTIPLVSFLLILPILDYYGYSFVPFLRRKFTLWRRRQENPNRSQL
jgi:hypothetical protein